MITVIHNDEIMAVYVNGECKWGCHFEDRIDAGDVERLIDILTPGVEKEWKWARTNYIPDTLEELEGEE